MLILRKIKNNLELFYLIVIAGLGVVAGSILAPVEALYINSLTDNKILLGLTFSVGTAFLTLISILIGRYSRKISPRRLALLGFALAILFPLIYASSINVFQYMFGRSAWAFAGVSTGVVLGALFQNLVAKKKNVAQIYGIKSSVASIAGAIGALTGGLLADQFGLRAPYYFIVIIYFLSLLLFFKYIYHRLDGNIMPDSGPDRKFLSTIKEILAQPYLFLRLYLEGITQSHWIMEPIIFPLIIFEMTGRNTATGIVFGLMGLVAMIALPLAGKYIDRRSSLFGLKIAFALYLLAFVVLALSKQIVLFALGAIILSLGKSFNGPAFEKIQVKKIKTQKRIEYLSYFRAYDTLTAVIAALVIGILLKYFTPHFVITLYLFFTLVGAVSGFAIFYIKMKQKKKYS